MTDGGTLTLTADGSYAARLVTATGGAGCYPERWTLGGPEPYAVPLPGEHPEDPLSEVQPLADGRVLISRPGEGCRHFALLYPSGPDTGELALGSVECEQLSLLPPVPDGSTRVYALVPEPGGTALWEVCGGGYGPQLVTRVSGWCSGGAWLDRDGAVLALDRTDATGITRTVTVDVRHGGEAAELLRIAEDSNDRLMLADPDSGLLIVRSDAPGTDRLGWAVLGSHRPVRFPEALHPEGVSLSPFAAQPGQVLLPEECAVALRMIGPEHEWVAVWRPQDRELRHAAAPEGWLAGSGRWTPGGELLLPYSSAQAPCGLFRAAVPEPAAAPEPVPRAAEPLPSGGPGGSGFPDGTPPSSPAGSAPAPGAAGGPEAAGGPVRGAMGVCTPIPLQQAPLARQS
ncbi:hypothetical protein GCM10009716_09230 [Streptomyces sodiiphilus]|uniref:Uncharacterized protein n=1 Tax=Streptomyces sodiiphilus TaxID=226217 RepID=A0ABN2NSU7_9ACTN